MTRVYFVRAGDKIKIGYASNVQIRIAALQIGCPIKMELLGTMFGGAAEEKLLHDNFAHLHLSGEWFREDQELLSFIRNATNFEGGAFRLRVHKVVLTNGEEFTHDENMSLWFWGDALEVGSGSGTYEISVNEIRVIYFKP